MLQIKGSFVSGRNKKTREACCSYDQVHHKNHGSEDKKNQHPDFEVDELGGQVADFLGLCAAMQRNHVLDNWKTEEVFHQVCMIFFREHPCIIETTKQKKHGK
jgi:hypothetical protein